MHLDPGALIGRTEELDRLRAAVGLGGRRGGIAILRGDAGIGKSRLLAALAEHRAADGWTLAVGHCVGQAWSTTAYLPFTELLGELGQALPDVLTKVRRTHPALGQLLDGAPAAGWSWPADQRSGDGPRIPPGHQTDPGQVAAGVHAVLLEAARERPLLAIVEDVHWADTSSRDLLTMLLTRGFAAPVALVISYRSDDLHRRHPLNETLAQWARIPRATRLKLSGLGDAEMSRLVWGLHDAPTSPDAVADVVRRAEGNAFFAEELVASSAVGAALGDDLARVLRSRLERLDTPTQEVVRAMAVGGRTVTTSCWPRSWSYRPADSRRPCGRRSGITSSSRATRTGTPSGTPSSVSAPTTTCCPGSARGCTGRTPTRWPDVPSWDRRPSWPGTPRRSATWPRPSRRRSVRATRRWGSAGRQTPSPTSSAPWPGWTRTTPTATRPRCALPPRRRCAGRQSARSTSYGTASTIPGPGRTPPTAPCCSHGWRSGRAPSICPTTASP